MPQISDKNGLTNIRLHFLFYFGRKCGRVIDDEMGKQKTDKNENKGRKSKMIDVKAKVEEIVGKISKDKGLQENFRKEPVKTVEGLLGVDLPDDVVKKVVDGVKGKISVDKVSDAVSSLKKLF